MNIFAGVDEAGRGPLAGPVVAAAVVLTEGQMIAGVRDSKRLSARQREQAAVRIRSEAAGWAIAIAEPAEIDAVNILQATMLAMRRAIVALPVYPVIVRIDGNRCPDLPSQFSPVAVIGGDGICQAIAAASILAKVFRDSLMDELHAQYPQYGFDCHRGYPTALHQAALEKHGPCPAHRSSFAPVRRALQLFGTLNS